VRVHSLNASRRVFRFCKPLIPRPQSTNVFQTCSLVCALWRRRRPRRFTAFRLGIREIRTAAREDAWLLGDFAFACRCICLCQLHAVLGLRWSHTQAWWTSESFGLLVARHLCCSIDVELQDGVALLHDSDRHSPWRSRILCTKRKNSEPASDSSLGSLSGWHAAASRFAIVGCSVSFRKAACAPLCFVSARSLLNWR
jgi:hypothetical protein